jgi:hypothetical protein
MECFGLPESRDDLLFSYSIGMLLGRWRPRPAVGSIFDGPLSLGKMLGVGDGTFPAGLVLGIER